MDGSAPPRRPSVEEAAEEAARRRRRIRNWVLLASLLALAALFYGIAVVRMAANHQLPHFR
ncbi:MAG: hypothetical protein M0002_10695 [Rhodospirillales bacterium]|nr:hypothetical protein [Rhodospirillales bacterium]